MMWKADELEILRYCEKDMQKSILRINGLDIIVGGRICHGANQDWFAAYWHRKAGCGPTTAANILRYMANRLNLPMKTDKKQDMQKLMEWTWDFVTPGLMGLNSTELFRKGMDSLLQSIKSPLRCRVLNIEGEKGEKLTLPQLEAFLYEGLSADSPIAFLNLDRGALLNLESWHWVTIIGIEKTGDQLMATCADNGGILRLDMTLWLQTTKRHGGFVYLK